MFFFNVICIATWKQRTTEKHEVNTKTTPVKTAIIEDVVDNKHHHRPRPVATTDVLQSMVSSQGDVTYVEFEDKSFNITAKIDLGLSTSSNKRDSSDRTKGFNSKLDETQSGAGFFWANGKNTHTQSSADQRTQLKYKDSDRCNYSRDVKISAQKVVADKTNNKCQ